MLGDDIHQNGQQQALVVMDSDVAERHHAFERGSQGIRDVARLGQQGKDIPCALRHTQAIAPHQMLAHVQRGLTRALNIEYSGVLPGEICGKGIGALEVLFPGASNTALHRGRLIEQHVISHTPCLAPECQQEGGPELRRERFFRSAQSIQTGPPAARPSTNKCPW